MGRIIAVANQKGGVGKTTTAINLAACLAEAGKKVLTIDLDPQGNMTSGLGVDKNEVENTVYELMLDECSVKESMTDTVIDGMKVIPSNVNLAGAEIELLGIPEKEYILRNAVDYIKEDYDFIVIDCPPSLNMLTINAMTTANSVLVPIQCEYYALEGLSQLIHTIDLIKERLNPKLEIEGVVFTMYDARTNLSLQVVENVKENLDKFKDADKITDYAKTAMQWAVGSGLMKGKSGNLLDPQGTATRAEIAAMLHRFIEKYELVQGKAPGGLMGWIDPKRLQIPKTGDSSVLGLWGFSLCASLAGCLALTTWQIRRRREEEALQIIEK